MSLPASLHTSPRAERGTRLLRGIAAFEAFKGLVALAAALGLLSLANHDVRHAAQAFIGHVGSLGHLGHLGHLGQTGDVGHLGHLAHLGHVGHPGPLSPQGPVDPGMTWGQIDRWLTMDRTPLLLMAAGYVALRFTEAYGLWHARPWGERLGALSGALYVPFELRHLLHRPSALAAAVLAANLAVVAFLVWRLRRAAPVAAPLDAATP